MNLSDIKKIGFNVSMLTEDEKIIINFLLNKGLDFYSKDYLIEIKESNKIILSSDKGNITISATDKLINMSNSGTCIEISYNKADKVYLLKYTKITNPFEAKQLNIDTSNNLVLYYSYVTNNYFFNCLIKPAGIHHQKKYYIESDVKGNTIRKKKLDYIPTSISEQGYNDIYFLDEIYDYIENIKEKDIENSKKKSDNSSKKLVLKRNRKF